MRLPERGIPMGRASADAPVPLPPQPRLVLPLLWGEQPLVQPGQRVRLGQRIADGGDETVPLYASVSGSVAAVAHHAVAGGRRCLAVVLDNDGEMTPDPSICSRPVLDELDDAALLSLLYEAGLRLPDGTPLAGAISEAGPGLQTLILSAMDPEPTLCAEDAALCYDAEAACSGIRLLERLLRPRSVLLAVGAGQKQALSAAGRWVGGRLRLAVTPDVYPNAHPQLLAELLGGQKPGQTAREAGVLVLPISAAVAAARAVYDGLPAVEQLVSVAWEGGSAVYRVPLGAPVRSVLRAAGRPEGLLLLGGPMTGAAMDTPDVPVTLGMAGLTVLPQPRPQPRTACIRCGRCEAVCPVDLQPWRSQTRAAPAAWPECLSCGACQYACPAGRPLLADMGRRAVPAAVG